MYRPGNKPEDYLVYIGRISREKKVESAIDIAVRSGLPLKIAAKVDKLDLPYFEERIKPLLEASAHRVPGRSGGPGKERLVGSALAFLHPIDWPEPFGLSMIEAMACGTPVIARKRGAIPEVVDDGINGLRVRRRCGSGALHPEPAALAFLEKQLPQAVRGALPRGTHGQGLCEGVRVGPGHGNLVEQ